MRKRKQKLRLENRKEDLNITDKSKSMFWNKLTGKPLANQRKKKRKSTNIQNEI